MDKEKVVGFIRSVLYITVAAGAGVGAVFPLIDWEKAELSPAFLMPILYAFGRAAIIEWNKTRPDNAKGKGLL